ncbi:unnamed protein product [Ranitomeya imitator]|uniref:Uncharacterized protein n=1 Tax=Ranitomeya imitator TaxID=111125 RepID=A0ABN9MIY9_9NEOB|nr:unnamed protein product [Ranitomeya imitator]
MRPPFCKMVAPREKTAGRTPGRRIGDRNGELTARMNVTQLQSALGIRAGEDDGDSSQCDGYEAQGMLQFVVSPLFFGDTF